MNIRNTFFSILAVGMMLLPLLGSATAASTIMISEAGNSIFLIEGTDIQDAAALDIAVSYDPATLSKPRVVEGPLISGSLTAFNPNTPGILRLGIIRTKPIKGSGLIATITFDKRGDNFGKILSLSARLANMNGSAIPVLARVVNSASVPDTAISPDNSGKYASPHQTSAASSVPESPVPPIVMIAGEDIAGRGKDEDSPPSNPETVREPAKEPNTLTPTSGNLLARGETVSPVNNQQAKIYAPESVLTRFKEYKGARTIRGFVSLFEKESMIGCRQEPPIALSDGKTTVHMTFITSPGKKISSDVAVIGARLISFKKDPDNTNTWVAELLPEKGSFQASLALLQGDMNMVCPLTVAPRIVAVKQGQIDDKLYKLYLQERAIPGSLKFDFNHDKKIDYIDDYIFTANQLAETSGGHISLKTK